MSAIAKITAKCQTTIPQQIRVALSVKPGDFLVWDVTGDGEVRVRRLQPLDLEYLRALEATLAEWGSTADDEAYRDL